MGLLQSIDATQRKTLSALAFLTFVAVSKTLLTKLVFTHVHTPVAFSVLSCVATNVCMSPIFFFKRDLWARPSRASLKGFALVCLAIAVDLGFTNVAISLLSVALQQCIKATSPTATVLLESILERKWQHPAIYAIVCLMVVGPVLAQFGSTFGDADPVGIVMMVLAVISGAFKYVLAHKVIKEYRHSMGTLAFTFWVEVIVGVVLLPWALLNGELYKLATGEEASTVGEWVLLLLTAAYGGVRIFSQFYLLQFTSATTLSLSNMAIQAFTIILGILFFGSPSRACIRSSRCRRSSSAAASGRRARASPRPTPSSRRWMSASGRAPRRSTRTRCPPTRRPRFDRAAFPGAAPRRTTPRVLTSYVTR